MIEKITAFWYWLKIFLSPVFIAIVVIGILSSIFSFSWWFCFLFLPAAIVGFLVAENARNKYGTSNYWSKTMNTPDIKETWEIENGQEEDR